MGKFISDYLSFTRKERIGVFIILLIISLSIFLPLFFSTGGPPTSPVADTALLAAVKQIEENAGIDKNSGSNEPGIQYYQNDYRKSKYNDTKVKGELFYFDPNTLGADGWEKLGLKEKTIQTIQKYISKGGVFKYPGDLKKVYGLHSKMYERIAPYVRIEESIKSPPQKTVYEPNFRHGSRTYQQVDINLADTVAFINLPGIGSKLASRIVLFREKLGGFYRIEQVSETFGLPDSTFLLIKQYLLPGDGRVKQLNINTATTDELKAHPYIKFTLANAIVLYRNEHGPFQNLEDLKKIMLITDEVFQKLSPYLTVN